MQRCGLDTLLPIRKKHLGQCFSVGFEKKKHFARLSIQLFAFAN